MKTNPNDTVDTVIFEGNREENGLTKREYFASMALTSTANPYGDPSIAAQVAVEMADALIEELNKKKEG